MRHVAVDLHLDNRGRIRLVSAPDGGRVDAFGTVRYRARRFNLAEAVVTADPASILNGTVTDGGEGAGISVPLLGTKLSTEITDDSWFATYPLRDIHGSVVGGEQLLSVGLIVMGRATVPVATDSVRFGVVLHNERDFRSATVDGRGISVNCLTTNPQASAISILNGTTSFSSGTANASLVGATANVGRPGQTATGAAQWLGHYATGLDSNFDAISGTEQAKAATTGNGPGVAGIYYATIFACRTNIADTDPFTVRFDAWHTPIVSTGRLA